MNRGWQITVSTEKCFFLLGSRKLNADGIDCAVEFQGKKIKLASRVMSSSEEILERFNMFYGELDNQMVRLGHSGSFLGQFSMHSDDAKILSRVRTGEASRDVDQLIKSATEFESELKGLRRKVAQRTAKTPSMKSNFPPIWDGEKLSHYIDSILGEVYDPCEEVPIDEQPVVIQKSPESKKKQEPTVRTVVKPILKSEKSKSIKRNVATNVKFQIHSEKAAEDESQKVPSKKTKKKVQTVVQPQLGLDASGGTIFPCCMELDEPKDGSVDVNSTKRIKTSEKACKPRPQTAPSSLKYSPMTVTSTAGQKRSSKQQRPTDDDVVNLIENNLATDDVEGAKQMTARLLPVLSFKGSCAVQKIYQLEISPTHDVRSSVEKKRNIKFKEFVHDPQSSAVHEPSTRPKSPAENSESSAVDVEEDERNFMNVRDVNKMLSDCGVHLRDGKIHVVVESGRKRKSSKRARARKSFKPSALRRSIDEPEMTQTEAVDDERKKINICTINDHPTREEKADESNEKDSSMSSSITDDGKIRQILMINRDYERFKRPSRKSSTSDSYPSSTGKFENSAQPPTDVGRSLTENFQSIYQLIEDTFEPIVVEPAAAAAEKEKESDDGLNEMKETIKMSEENIQRAGMLLQKYQKPNQAVNERKQTALKEIITEDSVERPTTTTAAKKVLPKSIDDPELSKQFMQLRIQKNDEALETCSNYQTFTSGLADKQRKVDTADSCVQTSEDKNIQTVGNINWKTQLYFGSVYEKYSNFNHIRFHQPPAKTRREATCTSLDLCSCVGCERKRNIKIQAMTSPSFAMSSGKISSPLTPLSSISASPKLSVPYNPIYSDDDEVMKAANKFLRSVEKRKKRNADSDITSSEASSSSGFSPQKPHSRKSSSSISTPSSEVLNHLVEVGETFDLRRPVPTARRNLESNLQTAATESKSSEPFDGESNPRTSSSHPSQLESPDSQADLELLERYLSEGEVLSQGEIQLGLSDDYGLDDDF